MIKFQNKNLKLFPFRKALAKYIKYKNNKIIFEESNNNMIYYIRDEEGSLIGLKYNNSIYYYIKNLQEDIIGITDSNYNEICRYEYDSFGKIITIKDNNGNIIEDESHIGIINPYRYRSYYYDKETDLYYLNSRYYNPEWGRFINADGIIKSEENKYNLYIYCKNNPIKFVDNDGRNSITAGWDIFGKAVQTLGEIWVGIKATASAAAAAAFPYVAMAVGVGTLIYASAKIEERTKDKSKKDKDYYVYKLQDCTKPGVNGEACKVEYIGRTGNLNSARARHSRNDYRKNLEFRTLEGPMDYDMSRVREQYNIKKYRTLNKYNRYNNQINGLSPSKYEKYAPIIDGMDLTYVGGSLWFD